jgi:hypothetical protein
VKAAQRIDAANKSDVPAASPLQEIIIAQPAVLIGLIAHLVSTPLQDDIVYAARRLLRLGQDIIAASERRPANAVARPNRKVSVTGAQRARPSSWISIFCSTRAASIFRPDHRKSPPLARRACQGWSRFARPPAGLGLDWPEHGGKIGWSGEERAGLSNSKPVVFADFYAAANNEKAPTKFWLSTLGANVTFTHLVRTAKLRWRIERDYLELKQEIGLGHFEGRGWRGFHHHATLCIAAYAFLVAERAAFPPSQARCGTIVKMPALPEDYRPRGAANPYRTPRPEFNCNSATWDRGAPRRPTRSMPMLLPTSVKSKK